MAKEGATAPIPPAQPYTLHVTCRPALLSTTMVSVACDAWQYLGGAHGMHGTTGHNYFVMDSGAEAIELSGILNQPDEGSVAIASFALVDLREQGATLIEDGIVNELEPRHLSNFTFTPDGLVLHFAPYIVGSYAEGDYEVVLDYTVLRPLLRPGQPQRAIVRASSMRPSVNVVLDFEARG